MNRLFKKKTVHLEINGENVSVEVSELSTGQAIRLTELIVQSVESSGEMNIAGSLVEGMSILAPSFSQSVEDLPIASVDPILEAVMEINSDFLERVMSQIQGVTSQADQEIPVT